MKAIYLLLPLYLFTYSAYSIELHVWHDENGVKHISMIPREGFNSDGTVKDEYNPNSFVYQHKHLNKSFKKNENERVRKSLPEWKEKTVNNKSQVLPSRDKRINEAIVETARLDFVSFMVGVSVAGMKADSVACNYLVNDVAAPEIASTSERRKLYYSTLKDACNELTVDN